MRKIRFFISAIGFLLFFAVFTSTVQANEGDTYGVGTDGLNVRSAPSHSAEIIGHLNSSDQVVAFQEKHGWVQTYYDGQVVWVASQYLYPTESNTSVSGVSSSGNESSAETQQTNASSGTLDGYNIILDPGHGGKDSGATSIGGTPEKNHTTDTAHIVAEGLREAGATVLLTRSNDKFVSLEDRVGISHAYATDAFISLHYNAFPLEGINGFSTYYDTDRSFATAIQSGLEQHMELNSRGLMQNDFHVMRENSDLSVLLELGYITNPYDFSVIQTGEHQRNVADGIVDGVKSYFNE